jgi:formylglycine-generating enzyme required for sulfatase activity/3',5'-cyclic AMP phosphodiesterase CpdA
VGHDDRAARPERQAEGGDVSTTRDDTRGPIRLLHLSDIHFEADETWERRAVLADLIPFVRDKVAVGGARPNLVLVTGDVAASGKVEEYERAEAFLLELMDVLGLEARDHLFIVPGNHDVDRKRIGPPDRFTIQGLLDAEEQEQVEAVLRHPMALSALGTRLDAFYSFTRRLLGDGHAWTPDRPWRADRVEVGGTGLGLVQLNSAWASGPDDAKGRLLVGEAQVRDALAELPDTCLRVAMAHHPPSWLAEWDEQRVRPLLHGPRGVDVVLHGHTHDEDSVVLLGPDGSTIVLGADATCTEGRWHKGFTLVTLDPADGSGQVRFFGYDDRKGGRWVVDRNRYDEATDGTWTFSLSSQLHAGADPGSAPCPPEDEDGAFEARVARYRSSAVSVHGAVSFIGLPDKTRRPASATVADLFAPLRASRRGAGGAPTLEVADLARAVTGSEQARRLVLLGDPGSGKTTLTRYLSVWLAGGLAIEGVERPEGLVPLRLPFREYVAEVDQGKPADLLEFLVRQSGDLLQCARDKNFFKRLLGEGRAVLFLDGLDEVSRPEDRAKTTRRVLAFATRWKTTPILVTSRPVGYDAAALPDEHARGEPDLGEADVAPGRAKRGGFGHLVLQPLDDGTQGELVRRWYRMQEPTDLRTREQMTADLLAALEAEPRARELARNPLLATLVCLVHRQRATLPGERVKLYELVTDTLLWTWNQPKQDGLRFEEIDAGRQRRYLESLALRMQEQRVERQADKRRRRRSRAESDGEVVIGHQELVRALTGFALQGGSGQDEAEVEFRMARWVDWLAARTGLLVEQRPGVFSFLHLTLMEYLAACALSRTVEVGGAGPLVERLTGLAGEAAWHETIRMVMGCQADAPSFLETLAETFVQGERGHVLLLLDGLREEVETTEANRRRILEAVFAGRLEDEAVRKLLELVRFSGRHGEGTRAALLELLSGCQDVRDRLPTSLLAAIPSLAPQAEQALDLVEQLRQRTSEGEQLYFLWDALDETARRWPEAAAEAEEARARLFDHLAEPPRELFETVRTCEGEVPLWREIPTGTFLMGSPESEEGRFDQEGPQHEVTLTQPFRMACVLATARMFQSFDPDHRQGGDLDHPVTKVSWFAAVSFCRWLAARAAWGHGARLPTEAEWEYACRAGTTARFWPGDGEEDLDRVGWYGKNSGRGTHPAGEKPANPWGLHDVHGNVRGWCADWFGAYPAEAQVDPAGPPSGDARVIRGGSWGNTARGARSAFRDWLDPDVRWRVLGFRPVLPVAPQPD